MSAVLTVEASAESVRSDATAAVAAEDKRTPDNSVPNVIITCTVDDDVETTTNALYMVDTFSLPTADEVSTTLTHRLTLLTLCDLLTCTPLLLCIRDGPNVS